MCVCVSVRWEDGSISDSRLVLAKIMQGSCNSCKHYITFLHNPGELTYKEITCTMIIILKSLYFADEIDKQVFQRLCNCLYLCCL